MQIQVNNNSSGICAYVLKLLQNSKKMNSPIIWVMLTSEGGKEIDQARGTQQVLVPKVGGGLTGANFTDTLCNLFHKWCSACVHTYVLCNKHL